MRIEPASRRVAPASALQQVGRRTRDTRILAMLQHVGLVVGMLLLAAGGAIALLPLYGLYGLYGLHAMPSPDDIAQSGNDVATFRCGMPVAAGMVALMFALPTATVGGSLMAWRRPTRTQRGRRS